MLSIELAKAGCHVAFTDLVNTYYPTVVKQCAGILGDPFEAEDLAQDVFADVYTSIGKFRGEAKFSTWLFRIASNKAFKRRAEMRRRFALVQMDIGDPEENDAAQQSFAQTTQDLELRTLLWELVEALPPLYGTVVKLRLMGYKLGEISTMTDCPVATVKTRMHRAVELMKKEVNCCDV